mmetsp:Transcript_131672/g.421255  ORF Transcript_131672/g.421255 Transcript_131672/m.421255 type:complete len:488 (-) Transcript_131672:181-1644(-)
MFVDALAGLLRQSEALQTLELHLFLGSQACFHDAMLHGFVSAIVDALRYNRSLPSLIIRLPICCVDNTTIRDLAEALRTNSTLETFELCGRLHGAVDPDQACAELQEAVRANYRLTSLKLDFCSSRRSLIYPWDPLEHFRQIEDDVRSRAREWDLAMPHPALIMKSPSVSPLVDAMGEFGFCSALLSFLVPPSRLSGFDLTAECFARTSQERRQETCAPQLAADPLPPSGPEQAGDTEAAVIDDIEHEEPAAALDVDEAAQVNAQREVGWVERLIETAIPTGEGYEDAEHEEEVTGRGTAEEVLLLDFNRIPKELLLALATGLPLHGCREALGGCGHECRLINGSLVFVHPWQYADVRSALVGHELRKWHVVVSRSLAHLVEESISSIDSRFKANANRRPLGMASSFSHGDIGSDVAVEGDADRMPIVELNTMLLNADDHWSSWPDLDVKRTFLCSVHSRSRRDVQSTIPRAAPLWPASTHSGDPVD